MSLEHLVPLKDYVPAVYKDVKEMDVLVDVQEEWFKVLTSITDKEYARLYIQTCDEIGIARFERVLKITANPSVESLDFRKERALTRCNATLPYTAIWLRIYLNAILGEHNYELDIDYDNDIITLYGYVLDYSWAKESSLVIRDVKPCNMVFINIPTLIEHVCFMPWLDDNTWDSNIWNDNNLWTDFKLLKQEELINYKKQTSGPAHDVLNESISFVTLNGTQDVNLAQITEQDGVITATFEIPGNVELLELVELKDKNGGRLLIIPCYIDTPAGTIIQFRISCYIRK